MQAIQLRPGIAFCLRCFHVLLTQMIRNAWLQYVPRVNTRALGITIDMAEFLFGTERPDRYRIRLALTDLQAGSLFLFQTRSQTWRQDRSLSHAPAIQSIWVTASREIAEWAYEQAVAAGSMLWLSHGTLVSISADWRKVLSI